jgi:nucleotide-binding universal stress UspA family protein
MIVVALVVIALLIALIAVVLVRQRRRPALTAGPRRILFPFTGHALSQRALDAALRLARAENATLVPVFLARVPMQLALDSPLPRQCTAGLPLLETIEQRAAAAGVPVDSRVDRGRTLRHAMREAIDHERFDRLVVAAGDGFDSGDVAWLLDHAPGEVVIVRPAGEARDERRAHRPQPLAV